LPLRDDKDRKKYLYVLSSGALDLFQRDRSLSKDMFWELEVWSKLKIKLPQVVLQEPPDIVVEFGDARIGIACKKIYSEKHVQNVLSQAVAQIEDSFEFGVVAINLDDLTPADSVLRRASAKEIGNVLLDFNAKFLRQHERHFRKYLSTGRLISAMVSTNIIADIYNEKPRFNNAYQWTIWTIPGLNDKKKEQLDKFYELIMR